MRVLIIEDEIPAAERLRELIHLYDNSIVIDGPLDSNEAVINWFETEAQPQLIFSDIELLDGPVFYALERIELESPIIFTTAYDQYALEAFKTNGIAYLLKPFDLQQLTSALDKFQNFKETFQKAQHQQLIEDLKKIQFNQGVQYKSRLTIKSGQGMYLLNVEEIACIGTVYGLAYAFTANGKKQALSNLIAELQEQLNPAVFHRINRSEIVNVNFIERIEPYFNDRLAVSVTGQKKPLISSAAKTPEFRKWLNQL